LDLKWWYVRSLQKWRAAETLEIVENDDDDEEEEIECVIPSA
jgi:hypothetical protein